MEPDGAKRFLTVVQSTHASLGGFSRNGLFKRHQKLISEYSRRYEVAVYSSDQEDFCSALGARHIHPTRIAGAAGLSHIQYFHWLTTRAPGMKGVIKVFGCNIPTLARVRSRSGCPVAVTYQWDYSEGIRKDSKSVIRRAIAPFLERRCVSAADLVLVTTQRLEKIVRSRYGRPTAIVPNWIDLDEISDRLCVSKKDPELIIFAGRLHHSKGLEILIRAFGIASAGHPKASLEIFGCGEDEERLRQIATDLGMGRIRFLGVCENSEVLHRMRQASIFVLPTLTMEGQPKALLEAMACGAACVGSDVPGISDIVEHGRSGMLFPAGDTSALADTLNKLLADVDLRESLAQQASMLVGSFSLSSIVEMETALLEELRAGSA